MSRAAFPFAVVGAAAAIVSLAVSLTTSMRGQVEHSPTPATSATSVAESAKKHGAALEACAGLGNFKIGVGIARGAFNRSSLPGPWTGSHRQASGDRGY